MHGWQLNRFTDKPTRLRAGVLWDVAPKAIIFLIVYSLGGTFLTTSAFGKRLMQLDFSLLRQEGDLRFGLVRTRENAGKQTQKLAAVRTGMAIGACSFNGGKGNRGSSSHWQHCKCLLNLQAAWHVLCISSSS